MFFRFVSKVRQHQARATHTSPHRRWASSAFVLSLLLSSAVLTACTEDASDSSDDIGEGGAAGHPSDGGAGEGASSEAGGGSVPEGGEGAGGAPPSSSCEPYDDVDVTADCGVFVDANAGPGGEGTQSAPFGSITEAMLASPSHVYVCDHDLHETVTLPPDVEVHGGLDCEQGWRWDFKRQTLLTHDPDVVPLRVHGGNGSGGLTKITGFHVVAASSAQPEGSSIAVILDHAKGRFERSTIEAGDALQTQPPGTLGVDGANGESAVGQLGGLSSCGSIGGDGGDAALEVRDGSPGMPMGGAGGIGLENEECTNGAAGSSGASLSSEPPDAFGRGMIDVLGFHPPAAGIGLPGQHGNGGGGGAAIGLPGGGGGAGGCGGTGGGPGLSGGSSIAVISIDSILTFQDTHASSGLGGNGSAGGLGGLGGEGASGDLEGNACNGGPGGRGANGGVGGKGAGGHSIVVAYTGLSPVTTALSIEALPASNAGSGSVAGIADHKVKFD